MSASGGQRRVAARHEAAHALAYVWQGMEFTRTEIDQHGLGWTGPDEPREADALALAVVALVGPVVEYLEMTGGDEALTLRSVLEQWQEVQECEDVELIEESDDYSNAGPYGALMLPLSFAYVVAGAPHIDDVAADLLAAGSLTYAEVVSVPRDLDRDAVCMAFERARGFLSVAP
jgi:hypothetical protein